MGVVGGVQEESCAELTGGHPNPCLMVYVLPTGYFLRPAWWGLWRDVQKPHVLQKCWEEPLNKGKKGKLSKTWTLWGLKSESCFCPPSRKNLQLLPPLATAQGLWIYVWSYPEDYGFLKYVPF